MGRRILLFALSILMILSAEVFLAGRPSRAADDCITKPGAAPPQGSHWYYRLDRANNRQCWRLREAGLPTRPAAPPKTRRAESRAVEKPAQPAPLSRSSREALFEEFFGVAEDTARGGMNGSGHAR